MTRIRVDWPVFALIGGVLLAQIAWLVGVPPFRGMDEWDHAYRAAAVAEGEWVAEPTEATRGTGAVLRVPEHIVAAARPECERLPYTKAGDCVGRPEGETVLIASGAGRYHPAFYALIGHPAKPFAGSYCAVRDANHRTACVLGILRARAALSSSLGVRERAAPGVRARAHPERALRVRDRGAERC